MAMPNKSLPKAGETYRCDKCGMEMKVQKDCNCKAGCPTLECCGQQLSKS